MASTTSPPRRLSPGERRARRERRATWITLSVVAIICAVMGVGAYAMANSWWVADAPAPSADQQLADGQSRFDRAGVDFLNRQRLATVDIAAPARASELGLPSEGETPVETLVPLTVEVRGDGGEIAFPGVSRFSLQTADDRLTSLSVTPGSSGAWTTIRTDLERRAGEWGWTANDLATLEAQVGEAAREEGDAQTVSLPRTPVDGMTVSADVVVDESGRISLRYVFAP